MTDDIITRIDVDSSAAIASVSAYSKAQDRLATTLAYSTKKQAEYDAIMAKSGAGTDKAVAAQARLDAALKRTGYAEQQVAIAAAKSAEIQAAASAKASAAAEAASAKQAAAFKKIGTIAGGVGLVAAAGLFEAAKAAAGFASKMAQVQSLTRANATDMQALTEATKGFANIGASASDAADAEIELVKAGISVKDIVGGALSGALNLAAAGQVDFGTATSIAAAAMTEFQLAGKDIPHVADLLAAGADRALGSVQDLGEGMTYVGLGAHQLGISIDDTVAALAEFANAGLIGSQGGTTLQQVLRQLTGPTDKAAAEIKSLGLNLYDAQGNFVGLASVAGQLHDKLSGMSQAQRDVALNTLFTSRAVRGATILYQDGAKGVEDWQKKVEASGFAAQQASGKMDSLSGDFDKLKASVTNTAIDFGQQLQPALRAVTQDLSAFVGFLDNIPGPLKEAAALTLAFTAAVGIGTFVYTRASVALGNMARSLGLVAVAETEAGAAAQVATNRMALMRTGSALAGVALLSLSANSKGTASGMESIAGAALVGNAVLPGWGAAIGAAAATVYQLGQNIPGATANVDVLTNTLDKNTGAWTKNSQQVAYAAAVAAGPSLEKVGLTIDTYTKALLGNANAMGTVYAATAKYGGVLQLLLNAPIDAAVAKQRAAQDAYYKTAGAAARLATAAGATNKVFSELGPEAAGVAPKLKSAGDSADGAAGKFKHLAAQAHEAMTAMLAFDNLALGKRGDWANYQSAIDGVTAALKKSTDGSIKAGTVGGDALDGMASSALQFASDFKAGSKAQIAFLEKSRTSLYQQAIAFGATKKEARKYVDTVMDIPDSAKTRADIDTIQAMSDIKDLQKQYSLTPDEVKSIVTAAGATTAIAQVQALVAWENRLHDQSILIGVTTQYTSQGTPGGGGGHVVGGSDIIAQHAAGGRIGGVGTGTSDSNVIRASRDEFMIQEKSSKSIGYPALDYMNRTGRIPDGLSGGGMVGRSYGGGSTTHTYSTDLSPLIAEIRALKTLVAAGIKTTEQKPENIARVVQGTAQLVVSRNRDWQASQI